MIPVIMLAGLLSLPVDSQRIDPAIVEQASAHNRDGMIAMSKARFEDAIEHFRQAAALVPDYGITTTRGLIYTPNFMTGWSYEKLGRETDACRAFLQFLDNAPAQGPEVEKRDHAREFVSRHCPNMPSPSTPDSTYGL